MGNFRRTWWFACGVCAGMVLALGLAAGPARGQSDGLENWVDACDVTEPAVLKLLNAECAVIPKFGMTLNKNGSYSFVPDTFTYRRRSDPNNVVNQYCPTSKFFGQPRPAGEYPGRSGFLVGEDLVLTAAHGIPGDNPDVCANEYYFVFDYRSVRQPNGQCAQPQTTSIPASNVYTCAQFVVHGPTVGAGDFLLVRLDRPVSGHSPLRVRRSGLPFPGDRIVGVGHPDQLSTKASLFGSYAGEGVTTFGQAVFFKNVYQLEGSSGGMYYNLEQDVVESVTTGGQCVSSVSTVPGQCAHLVNQGCETIPGFGSPIVPFSAFIPPLSELVVSPLSLVVHEAPIGEPVTNPVTVYQLTAPANAAEPIVFRVVDPMEGVQTFAPIPELTWELVMPDNRKAMILFPGESATLTVHASAGAMLPGRQQRELRVISDANRIEERLRHVFEVGITEFVVLDAGGSTSMSGVVPPYEGSATYRVRSVRPSPVSVRIGATSHWPAIYTVESEESQATNEVVVNLAPAGHPGDEKEIVFAANQAVAAGLGAGSYPTTLEFANADPIDGLHLGYFSRSGNLDIQRVTGTSANGILIPDNSQAGVQIPIPVSGGFHVCDVDISLSIGVVNEGDPIRLQQLRIDLISPTGVVVPLWNHHTGSGVDRVFDDEGTPAPTGRLLSTFDGISADGVWTVFIADDVAGVAHRVKGITVSIDPAERPVCGP